MTKLDSPPTAAELLLTDYRQAVTQSVKELDRVTALVQSLPVDSPTPKRVLPYGSFASQTVQFSVAAIPFGEKAAFCAQLLELYPPVATVVHHDQQKPVSALNDADRGDLFEPTYPVSFDVQVVAGEQHTSRPHAKWWTDVRPHLGLTLVDLEGGAVEHFGLPNEQHTHVIRSGRGLGMPPQSIFVRKEKRPSTYPHTSTPLEEWDAQWVEFASQLGANALMQRFINVARAAAIHKGGLTLLDLPPVRTNVPGTAVKIGPQESFDDALAKLYPEMESAATHPWYRLGNFWAVFNEETAGALVTLSVLQAERLPHARAAMEPLFDAAEAWLTEALKGYSYVNDQAPVLLNLQQALCKSVGNGVQLSVVRSQTTGHYAMLKVNNVSGEEALSRSVMVEADSSKPVLTCANLELDYV